MRSDGVRLDRSGIKLSTLTCSSIEKSAISLRKVDDFFIFYFIKLNFLRWVATNTLGVKRICFYHIQINTYEIVYWSGFQPVGPVTSILT